MTRKVIRISDELVTKKSEVDTYLLYNGAPEEYEDAADYAKISTLKGRVIA